MQRRRKAPGCKPRLFRGVRCSPCAEGQLRPLVSLGKRGTKTVQNASVSPRSLSGGVGRRLSSDGNQPRRTRNGTLRGVGPLNSYGAVDNVCLGPGPLTKSNRPQLKSGPTARTDSDESQVERLQLRCKLTQPFCSC